MTMDAVDRLALSDLVHRYAAGVDDRRFGEVTGLFAEDATLSLPDPPRALEPTAVHRGQSEIETAVGAVAAVERTHHAIVGEVYTEGPPALAVASRASPITGAAAATSSPTSCGTCDTTMSTFEPLPDGGSAAAR